MTITHLYHNAAISKVIGSPRWVAVLDMEIGHPVSKQLADKGIGWTGTVDLGRGPTECEIIFMDVDGDFERVRFDLVVDEKTAAKLAVVRHVVLRGVRHRDR